MRNERSPSVELYTGNARLVPQYPSKSENELV
jgi:hypothetical protein